MIAREIRVIESYLLNHHTTFSCDYSCSTAAKSEDLLIMVAARPIKGLSKEDVRWLTYIITLPKLLIEMYDETFENINMHLKAPKKTASGPWIKI